MGSEKELDTTEHTHCTVKMAKTAVDTITTGVTRTLFREAEDVTFKEHAGIITNGPEILLSSRRMNFIEHKTFVLLMN